MKGPFCYISDCVNNNKITHCRTTTRDAIPTSTSEQGLVVSTTILTVRPLPLFVPIQGEEGSSVFSVSTVLDGRHGRGEVDFTVLKSTWYTALSRPFGGSFCQTVPPTETNKEKGEIKF